MNKLYILCLGMLLHTGISFAGFINGSFTYDNKVRSYSIYVPDMYYTENKAVPLLLGLHGFGDNISNFKNICMSDIADTANYICVYAEALPDPVLGANAWNSGASTGFVVVNHTAKDNGFLNALVDTVISRYTIDTTRMYVFGFSFGGFMTNRLGVENSDRFAAIASVSGLKGNSVTALPQKPLPYLHFHGTSDATIGYYGTSTLGFLPGLGMSAENTAKFWATQNQCNLTPVIDTMPNLANDGKRFVRFTYSNGLENSKVVFYKVINGEHSWYGLPSNDISYCQTIWEFFRQYSRTSIVSGVRNTLTDKVKISIFPNPSSGNTTIDFSAVQQKISLLNIYSLTGNRMLSAAVTNQQQQYQLQNDFPAGIYLLELSNENGIVATDKIAVQ
jgi:polyhydroxybutyrate depolymerase